jgi:hypothetical protein
MFATFTHCKMADDVRVKITLLPSLHGSDPVVVLHDCQPTFEDQLVVEMRSGFCKNSAADAEPALNINGDKNALTIVSTVTQM